MFTREQLESDGLWPPHSTSDEWSEDHKRRLAEPRARTETVMTRLRYDERTRRYVSRRSAEALSKPEIIRCLKRYVAREMYRALVSALGT